MNLTIAQHAKLHDLTPNKRLGQNFIFDSTLCDKIAKQCNIQGNHIIEVGPGPGGLTRSILALNPAKLTVIEKDQRCLALLEELAAIYPSMEIIAGDALKIELSDIAISSAKIHIISNLPYNIGTELLFKWLEYPELVSSMTLMLQKEVVDRICAKHGSKSYGKLSVMCQLIAEAQKLFDLSPQAFYPPPKVYSSVVSIIPRSNYPDKNLLQKVKKVVHLAFTGRRKMLKSSLKLIGGESLCRQVGIDSALRAENISVEEYLALAKALNI